MPDSGDHRELLAFRLRPETLRCRNRTIALTIPVSGHDDDVSRIAGRCAPHSGLIHFALRVLELWDRLPDITGKTYPMNALNIIEEQGFGVLSVKRGGYE